MLTSASSTLYSRIRALGNIVQECRQGIDVFELIALNVDGITTAKQGVTFFGWTQFLNHEWIAISLCKLFEREDRHLRNSVYGVSGMLRGIPLTTVQKKSLERFGEKHGNNAPCVCPISNEGGASCNRS